MPFERQLNLKGKGNPIHICLLAAMLLATSAPAQIQWAKRIASTTNQDNELSIGMTLGRVLRGGSWFFTAAYYRSAIRDYSNPINRDFNFGFRVLLAPGP